MRLVLIIFIVYMFIKFIEPLLTIIFETLIQRISIDANRYKIASEALYLEFQKQSEPSFDDPNRIGFQVPPEEAWYDEDLFEDEDMEDKKNKIGF